MSEEDGTDSNASSSESSVDEEAQKPATTSRSSKKKQSKAAKPRLTAVQKNTNHKDAENKRRNAIRERFTELSRMVPGAEGQERSEQVMLGKTTEFLRQMLEEQRQLEAIADAQGVLVSEDEKLKDSDFGGSRWRETHMDEYRAQKAKKVEDGAQEDEDD